MVMSTAPNIQAQLLEPGVPREFRIDRPIAPDAIQRLMTIPEFVKAYEPHGMAPEDFITYGPTQRTLAQFLDAGWALIEGIKLP
jgi:transaldolase